MAYYVIGTVELPREDIVDYDLVCIYGCLGKESASQISEGVDIGRFSTLYSTLNLSKDKLYMMQTGGCIT